MNIEETISHIHIMLHEIQENMKDINNRLIDCEESIRKNQQIFIR